MAFATSNVRAGIVGNLRLFAGEWSGSAGDASGTVTVGSGRVYDVCFWDQGSSSPKEWPQVDVSEGTSTSTITVHNHRNVTNGRFNIIYG